MISFCLLKLNLTADLGHFEINKSRCHVVGQLAESTSAVREYIFLISAKIGLILASYQVGHGASRRPNQFT